MTGIEELLTRSVANIIPGKPQLQGKLTNNKKLNIYLGIDPTSTKIHLGHAVVLRKLNSFAKLGHNVTFLIGDFTALIGDTSDKDSERPSLSRKEIEENFQTYKKQAEKVLDFSLVKIKFNSSWLKKLTFEDIIKLTQHFNVGDFAGRELIRKRLNDNKKVGLHEFLYPVMQGYDSFFLDTDLQIGGTDQTFNMQAGRTLIKDLKNKDSFVLSTLMLEGTDGRKMSKSWGNAIWLDDNPNDIFAKTMAVSDEYIINYFTLATNLPLDEIKKIEQKLKKENPINVKKILAFQITKELYDEKLAKEAQENFERTVQNKELPIEIPYFTPSSGASIAGTVSEWANISASEVKRVINQGGIEINGERIDVQKAKEAVPEGSIIKIGKKIVFKIKK